jgi:hypothetical protein
MQLSQNRNFLILLSFILTIGFIFVVVAAQQTVTEYKKAYAECMDAYTMAKNGYLPLWEETVYENYTIPKSDTIR